MERLRGRQKWIERNRDRRNKEMVGRRESETGIKREGVGDRYIKGRRDRERGMEGKGA